MASLVAVKKDERLSSVRTFFSGCISAVVTVFVVTPLDLAKTRMQVFSSSSSSPPSATPLPHPASMLRTHLHHGSHCALYPAECCVLSRDRELLMRFVRASNGGGEITEAASNSLLRTMRGIVRESGSVLGLWRGLLPNLSQSLPNTALYLVAYEKGKSVLSQNVPERYWPWLPLAVGPLARMVASTATSPIELIRVRVQAQNGSDISQVMRTVYASGGLRGFWNGLGPTLMRDVPFSALYWQSYELLAARLKQLYGNSIFVVPMIAGTVSGSFAAVVTTPIDVVKTRVQASLHTPGCVNQPSSWQTFLSILRSEGLRGLTVGMVPRVAKIAPACAIMISSYEIGKHILT